MKAHKPSYKELLAKIEFYENRINSMKLPINSTTKTPLQVWEEDVKKVRIISNYAFWRRNQNAKKIHKSKLEINQNSYKLQKIISKNEY